MTSVTKIFEFQSRNNNEGLSPAITVFSKAGVQQAASTMTHSSNGKYYYDFSTSTSGTYYAKIVAEGRTSITDFYVVSVSSTESVSGTVSGQYCATIDLNDYMNMTELVPGWEPGTAPNLENVSGNSCGTATIFYLDQRNVIKNTQTLSYGASTASTTALTETTHYTIDLDIGKVTITTAGTALVSTSTLYADYKYNTVGLKDSYLRDVLDRAESEIDIRTNTHFADGTQTTPDYKFKSKEYMEGKGEHRREYFTKKYPIPDVRTTLDGALNNSDTTITVASTTGFSSASTGTIETEQISWTGKTSTKFTGVTRGANSSSASTHATGKDVSWLVVETSVSDEGEDVTFNTEIEHTDFEFDYPAGRLRLMKNLLGITTATSTLNLQPVRGIPKRVRISYPYGHGSIYEDVRRACLMIASKDLMRSTMRGSITKGMNDFKPSDLSIDEAWIEQTLAMYRSIKGELI